MTTMTAAFFDGKGKMELRDHPKPVVGPEDIILNVKATGICGSDLQMNMTRTLPTNCL